jgi:hypothetical protein
MLHDRSTAVLPWHNGHHHAVVIVLLFISLLVEWSVAPVFIKAYPVFVTLYVEFAIYCFDPLILQAHLFLHFIDHFACISSNEILCKIELHLHK